MPGRQRLLLAAKAVEGHHLAVGISAFIDAQDALVVAEHQIGVDYARWNPGIVASCLVVRRHRGVEKPGIATGVDQPREVLGIDRAPGPLQQAAHRVHGAPRVALELGEVLVQDRQVRVEREGPLEGALGVAGTDGVVEVLPQGTRWQRPSPAQAGANCESSVTHFW